MPKPRRKAYHRAIYADSGHAATGVGKRSNIEAIAAAISHKGIGVGRETCIQKSLGDGPWKDTGVCFRGGMAVKKKRGQQMLF